MAKKSKTPPTDRAPEEPDSGPPDAKQPAGGDASIGIKPAKKKSGGSKPGQEANPSLPGTPAAVLHAKVEWRDPAMLKHSFASAVRKHTDDEYRDLCASIAERGILQPLLITPDGKVIEGNGRLRIARDSGMTSVPCVIVAGLADEDARSAAVKLNTDRRHLTPKEKEKAIRELLNRDPGLSDRHIAKQAHASHGTVAKKRKEPEATGQIVRTEERRDRHGVARPASANRNTAAKRVNTAAMPSLRTGGSAGSDKTSESSARAPERSVDGGPRADGPQSMVLAGLVAAVSGVESLIQTVIPLVRAGGPEANDPPAIAAIADTLARLVQDLNSALAPKE